MGEKESWSEEETKERGEDRMGSSTQDLLLRHLLFKEARWISKLLNDAALI